MAKREGDFTPADYGLAPDTIGRLRGLSAGALRAIQPDEFTVADMIREANITDAQARQIIRARLETGEIERVKRLRYREGQKPIAGNVLAYRFVKNKNAQAKPDKAARVPKAHSRAR